VIGRVADEAAAMLAEGVSPVSIEQAGLQSGYPVGPLQLSDELSLTLEQKIRNETREAVLAAGGEWHELPGDSLRDRMVEAGRAGRKAHAGYYDYDESGRRTELWPGLVEFAAGGTGAGAGAGASNGAPEPDGNAGSGADPMPFDDIKERMLFAEALEAVACFDEGVITSVADANIGSIFGIGYPVWTGGVLQYVNQYEGGIAGFVARADELAARYGARFSPSAALRARAERGEQFV